MMRSDDDNKEQFSKKEKDFCHNVRKYFREHNEVTGIHGLRYITEKRSKIEKIIWAIILLLALAGCFYMISEILQKYVNSPVVVSFATEDTPIHQIPFPVVTICPEAKHSGEKFNYSQLYYEIIRNETHTVSEEDLKNFYYLSNLCGVRKQKFSKADKIMDFGFFEAIDKLKPDPNWMFAVCSFMGEDDSGCDMLTPVILDQGICYSFNILNRSEVFRDHTVHYKHYNTHIFSNHFNLESGYSKDAGVHTYPRRALTSGADNAFQIFFSFSKFDADFICSSFLQGWRVSIHSPYDVPELSKNYFRVPFDKVVVAAVEPELVVTSDEVRRFSPEKRKCYMMDERPLKNFKVYTQSNCFLECLANYTLQKCDCVAFYMPRDNNTEMCGIGNTLCVEAAERETIESELEAEFSSSFKFKKSFCDCKPSCSHLTFNVETSHSTFYFKEYFEANSELSYLLHMNRSHWAVLSVYFKNEQFMPVERSQLYGVSDLISNLGGLVGLFTGFSLITVVEIIYFLSLRMFCNQRIYGVWSGPPN